MRTELINKDGRKYTLLEFFNEYTEGLFELVSIKSGHIMTGTREQMKEGLAKRVWGQCVQYIESDEYGTTIFLR